MNRGLFLTVLVAVAGAAAANLSAAALGPAEAEFFAHSVRPLTEHYCLQCHSAAKHKGDLNLESFIGFAEMRRNPETWERIAERLEDDEMPPDGKPRPSDAVREHLVDWIGGVLETIEKEGAADPGPVVLRRLTNAEYTNSIRDLTGIGSLDPAREFPPDGAAGEGFSNTGQAMVISAELLEKYFRAAQSVASHAVLYPDGIGFSAFTTPREWTDEIIAQIKSIYRLHSDAPAEVLNLRGLTNAQAQSKDPGTGGRLPLARYLEAMVKERQAILGGSETPEGVADHYKLSPKYCRLLWNFLNAPDTPPILDSLRSDWRKASAADVPALLAEISRWQDVLWKYSPVGASPGEEAKAWLQPVPAISQETPLRLRLGSNPSAEDVVAYFTAAEAGPPGSTAWVEWQKARILTPGEPDILLRDVPSIVRQLTERRDRILAETVPYLAAAAEADTARGPVDVGLLARRHQVDPEPLRVWLDYLGIEPTEPIHLALFTDPLTHVTAWDFIQGWGSQATPGMMANPAGNPRVRIPGIMMVGSVVIHPSKTEKAAAGWRSPISGQIRVEASVYGQMPEINQGFTWSLELRHGRRRERLAQGTAHLSRKNPNTGLAESGPGVSIGTLGPLAVAKGDLLSILISPWAGDNKGDTIETKLTITSLSPKAESWDLEREVSGNVLAGNPHADSAGRPGIWSFYSEPFPGYSSPLLPPGSLLDRWLRSGSVREKRRLASDLQHLLAPAFRGQASPADLALRRQLLSLASPFLAAARHTVQADPNARGASSRWGLDPARFGRSPDGSAVDPASFCAPAPSFVAVPLPADLFAGSELVATVRIGNAPSSTGLAQAALQSNHPSTLVGLQPGPVLAQPGSPAWNRFVENCDAFRRIFPASVCYSNVVPVDNPSGTTLFYRDDTRLADLVVDEGEKARLDRLWDRLRYVSQEPLKSLDVYEAEYVPRSDPRVKTFHLPEFPTRPPDPPDPPDAATKAAALRKEIYGRAAAFRQRMVGTEDRRIEAVLDFAQSAYRRPLTSSERQGLAEFYQSLGQRGRSHEEAVRLTLARVLVEPAFLYRAEGSRPGEVATAVTDNELATRLSYFLWSSEPDAELRTLADGGKLHHPEVLLAQTHRMLRDAKVRGLATEFGCVWVGIHDFDQYDEKSGKTFPGFSEVRGEMYEESIRFLTDLFQENRPVLNLIDADYTFLDERLAKFYDIPGVVGSDWRRVDGVRRYGRGGLLGQGSILAKRSGASRTSPILRGVWLDTVLLGDKLPKPPKSVPALPPSDLGQALSIRQLTERHVADAQCAGCHLRFDAFGFALENYDGIGRWRERDAGNRPIDATAALRDGAVLHGLGGLKEYILVKRRNALLHQVCRKLLGYALGRTVQFSDEPLLKGMQQALSTGNYQVEKAIDVIVESPQFQQIRGQNFAAAN